MIKEEEIMINFIFTLIIGGLSGWLAGKIMKSENGVIVNIILGLLGGVVGGFVAGLIGLKAVGIVGGCVVSVFGACLLIWLVRKFKK